MAAAEDPAFAGTPDRDTAHSPGGSRPADSPSPRSPDASEKIDTALRKADLPSPADDHTPDVEDHAPDAGKPKPGDLVAEPEANDKKARADRVRREAVQVGDRAVDAIGKGGNSMQEILTRRPPTGHPEVRTPNPAGAEMTPHYANHAGDMVAGVAVTALMLGELGRRAHGKMTQVWERRHDGDR